MLLSGSRADALATHRLMAIPRTAIVQCLIDLNQDGSYAGPYDDVTARVLGASGVSIQRGRDQSRGTGAAMVPAESLTLDNHDRQYSGQTGPLVGLLVPGRPTTTVTYLGGGTDLMEGSELMDDPRALMEDPAPVSQFTGTLDELTQDPMIGRRQVGVRALGRLLRLRGVRVTTGLYGPPTGITTGAAMAVLLAAAGLATNEYVIDADAITNGRLLSYWYLDDRDAYDAAVELLQTEGYPAALYEDGQGRVVFEGRTYRTLTPRSTTVQATFRDVDDGVTLYHTAFSSDPGFKDVVNAASVDVVPRAVAGLAVVWTYPVATPISIAAGGTFVLTAKPTDPFGSMVVPSTANGDIVASNPVTATLTQTTGGSTVIVLTAGGSPTTITLLQLRAQALTALSTIRRTESVSTTTSRAMHGKRSASPTVWPGLSPNEAASLADALVTAYQQPRPVFTITVVNADGRHLQRQLTTEVSDRIHIVEDWTGTDVDCFVEKVETRLTTGGLVTTIITAEQTVDATYAIWDVSEFDDVGKWAP